MTDFLGIEIKIGDRVFVSWGGKKHAVGKVTGFKGKKTVLIASKAIEKSTMAMSGVTGLEWNSENLIKLNK